MEDADSRVLMAGIPESASVSIWPFLCATLLFAGTMAGVVRVLRHGGQEKCVGIPLPQCRWLTSRWTIRIAAVGSFIVGILGLFSAFDHIHRAVLTAYDDAPPLVLSLIIFTYLSICGALLLTGIGLSATEQKFHQACRQTARAALLGGLAAGLATEFVCDGYEDTKSVPKDWRMGARQLGASSGMILFGFLAAFADGDLGRVGVSLESASLVPASSFSSDGLQPGSADTLDGGTDRFSSAGLQAARRFAGGAEYGSPEKKPNGEQWPQWSLPTRLSGDPQMTASPQQWLPPLGRPAATSSLADPLLKPQKFDGCTSCAPPGVADSNMSPITV